MNADREVRYERLRPAEIVAARQAAPVVYIPLGPLEWHGPHNPVGLDALKAHGLAVRCAQETGGLVWPPLWYGESRETALMEANAADREQIAEGMALPAERFKKGYMHTTLMEQTLAYERLLLHVLHQARSLGFQVAVLVAGHYPLIDHARAACALYHQMALKPRMLTWAFSGYELLHASGAAAEFDACGDHAGKWETSLLMALEPGLTALDRLPKEGPPVGTTDNGVRESSAEYGERAVAAIVAHVAPIIRHLLEGRAHYQGHGGPQYLQAPPKG